MDSADVERQIMMLNEQVVTLHRQGSLNEALEAAIRACDLARRHLKPEDITLAESLNNLAVLYSNTGAYTEAESLFKESLKIRLKTLGDAHPDTAPAFNNLADLYRTTGRYGEAVPLYAKALCIWRFYHKDRSTNYAVALNNIASLYKARGDYRRAEKFYRRALGIWRDHHSESDPTYATMLNNIAELFKLKGDYKAAEQFFDQSLEICREHYGKDHPSCITSLNNLAGVFEAVGRYKDAAQLYGQALDISRNQFGERHPSYAVILQNIAVLLKTTGEFIEAEKLYTKALEIKRDLYGEDHPSLAIGLMNLASLYEAMGKYAEAESLFKQVLEFWQAHDAESNPSYATALHNLGGLHEAKGDYVSAERLYTQAMEIRRQVLGHAHVEFASSQNSLAAFFYATGSYDKSEALYLQALGDCRLALGARHPYVAITLQNLAMVYQARGDYGTADEQYREAFDICRKAYGDRHPHLAAILHNRAVLLQMQGDYSTSLKLCQQATEMERSIFGEDSLNFAASLHNMALAHLSNGDYATSEQLINQAIDIWSRTLGQHHRIYARALHNLAVLLAATEREHEALRLIKAASSIDDATLGQVFCIGSEKQRMAIIDAIRGDFDLFLSLLYGHLFNEASAAQSALDFVLRRKAAGAEAISVIRDSVLKGRYSELSSRLDHLTALRAQISRKALAGPGLEGLQAHAQTLADWESERERQESELAHQIPELNISQKMRSIDAAKVARALPRDSVLVEFVRFDLFNFKAVPARGEARWRPANYLALILHAAERVELVRLGEAELIDRTISEFREYVTGEAQRQHGQSAAPLSNECDEPSVEIAARDARMVSEKAGRVEDAGEALRRLVFDPLLPFLRGSKRLFVAPDADLTRLPFQALPTGYGNHIIDEYQISYLSSGRDILLFENELSRQSEAPVVAADPDFNLDDRGGTQSEPAESLSGRRSTALDRRGLHFKRLEGTRVEGEQIAGMLGVVAMLGVKVLDKEIKAKHSPVILHIATHGFFLEDQRVDRNKTYLETELAQIDRSGEGRLSASALENPMLRSGLALAGANTWLKGRTPPPDAEDGILTAEDVMGMDLTATELVVLSACETGLGGVRVGEGVYGFRRAFVLAGAKTLIMSLWKVPDNETQELMENFYRRILSGENRCDALRGAQLEMKKKYSDPFYWAAFICQGNPDRLPYPVAQSKH